MYVVAIIESGSYKQNIEELSGQFEGDMVLTNDQERMLKGLDRTGLIDTSYRWPNNTVPYILSDIFSQAQKDYIELGLRELERISCIVFVPRTTEETFVSVEVSEVYKKKRSRRLVSHFSIRVTDLAALQTLAI